MNNCAFRVGEFHILFFSLVSSGFRRVAPPSSSSVMSCTSVRSPCFHSTYQRFLPSAVVYLQQSVMRSRTTTSLSLFVYSSKPKPFTWFFDRVNIQQAESQETRKSSQISSFTRLLSRLKSYGKHTCCERCSHTANCEKRHQ